MAYLLTPEAEVGGLLLDDGRQLRLPPHLSDRLPAIVRPGQRIRVSGLADRGDGRPGIQIESLVNGQRLIDAPPMPVPAPTLAAALPPGPPPRAELTPMTTRGKVLQVLTGPRGEPEGALLDNGEQIAVPPHAAWRLGDLLTKGATLQAVGYGRRSAYGTVLQATTLARPGSEPMAIYPPPTTR